MRVHKMHEEGNINAHKTMTMQLHEVTLTSDKMEKGSTCPCALQSTATSSHMGE